MSSSIEDIRQLLLLYLPKDARITRIEFEGPEIAVYVENVQPILESEDVIKHLDGII